MAGNNELGGEHQQQFPDGHGNSPESSLLSSVRHTVCIYALSSSLKVQDHRLAGSTAKENGLIYVI